MAKIEIQPLGLIKEVNTTVRFLDIARELGLDWMFSCTQGTCGTCLSTVLEGMDNLNRIGMTESETLKKLGAQPGQRLGCQMIVRGDVVIYKENFKKEEK